MTLADRIVAWLRENGPASDRMMAVALNTPVHIVQRRRLELVDRGVIYDTGIRTRSSQDNDKRNRPGMPGRTVKWDVALWRRTMR